MTKQVNMRHKGDFSHCHIRSAAYLHTRFPINRIPKHIKVFAVSISINIVYISNKGTVSCCEAPLSQSLLVIQQDSPPLPATLQPTVWMLGYLTCL